MIGLAVCVGLLIIFHRPILLAIGRQIALRYAAKENLKIDFVVEGNPFTRLTARNFHAFPTGPSAIESIDIDQLHVDYSLFGFWRHGISRLFDNVEARSARIVFNPSKSPLRTRPPKPHLKLPKFFPERVRLTDATVVVRNQPDDFVAEGIDLELDPRHPGELRIATLQLPSGDTWSGVSGEIEHLAVDGSGIVDQPRTWSGNLSLRMSDVHRPELNLGRAVVEISAEQGRGILRSAEIVQDMNEFHLRGGIELPSRIEDFGRTPANLEISGSAPDLERLTAGTPLGLTGSAQFTGRIDIVNATIQATLGVTADSVGFEDGIVDKLNCTLRASKGVASSKGQSGGSAFAKATADRPW